MPISLTFFLPSRIDLEAARTRRRWRWGGLPDEVLWAECDWEDPANEYSSDDNTSTVNPKRISLLCYEREMLVNKSSSTGRVGFSYRLALHLPGVARREACTIRGPLEDDAWHFLKCDSKTMLTSRLTRSQLHREWIPSVRSWENDRDSRLGMFMVQPHGLIGADDVSAELSRNFLSPGHEYFPPLKPVNGFPKASTIKVSHKSITLHKLIRENPFKYLIS